MSATTGIPSGSLWGGETSLPWTDRLAQPRAASTSNETASLGPPKWLVNAGQFLLAAVFTILSLPLMVIGMIVAAVLVAWSLLLPALAAGLVIVLASFVVAAV